MIDLHHAIFVLKTVLFSVQLSILFYNLVLIYLYFFTINIRIQLYNL